MRPIRSGAKGFSLVEVTLALGICAFCLLVLIGLLPVGLASNRQSVEQTVAGNIAATIASDLQSTPLDQTTSSLGFNLPVNASAASGIQTMFFSEAGNSTGTASQAAVAVSRFRASVSMTPPAGGGKGAVSVWIMVTWPAAADPQVGTLPSRFNGLFETVYAVNRK